MKNIKEAIGVGLQIVYEYPDWNTEHVADMLDTYESSGDPVPCSYNELYDICMKAHNLKSKGKLWEETEKLLGAQFKRM